MRYRRRLRSRIILSFFLFGSALTAAFALAAVLLREYLEDQLIGRQLRFEIDNYVEAFTRDPNNTLVPFSRIQGFVFSERKRANVPLAWRDLPDGVHTITDDSQSGGPTAYKLAVRKHDDFWFFLQYDISHELRLRSRLTWGLVIVVVLFAGLSALIAFWSADRVMRPVADLAARLSAVGPAGLEPLAPHFADDEVGQLAAALDDYASKLTELVNRDREFNADVSHELRTPIAVIRSATELLLAQNDLPERARERLLRIDRAARQSNELIEALLLLSRNERRGPSHAEVTDVVAVVEQVVEMHRAQIGAKPLTVRIHRLDDAPVQIDAPAAVLSVALSNLVGNAIRYTPRGEIRIVIENDGVRVEDEGPGIDAKDVARLFTRGVRGEGAGGMGAGLGLAIVRRLCDLYGWTVSLAPGEPCGAIATLRFG